MFEAFSRYASAVIVEFKQVVVEAKINSFFYGVVITKFFEPVDREGAIIGRNGYVFRGQLVTWQAIGVFFGVGCVIQQVLNRLVFPFVVGNARRAHALG